MEHEPDVPAGASHSSKARPTSPAARGAVNNATAETRSKRSLTSCRTTMKNASNDTPKASPAGAIWTRPATWKAAPALGTASRRPRGTAGRPAKGASASAVAAPYSASAMR